MRERRERYRREWNVGMSTILGENDVILGEGGNKRQCSRIVDGLQRFVSLASNTTAWVTYELDEEPISLLSLNENPLSFRSNKPTSHSTNLRIRHPVLAALDDIERAEDLPCVRLLLLSPVQIRRRTRAVRNDGQSTEACPFAESATAA